MENAEDLANLRLMATAFKYTNEAMLISDSLNRIVAINPAFTKVTGYLPSEILGKNPSVLASQRTPVDTYRDMWQSLDKDDHWQGEVWDQRKDATVYPKWLTISVARDVVGKVEYYIATFSDITERKEAAEKLVYLAHHDALTGLANRASLEV